MMSEDSECNCIIEGDDHDHSDEMCEAVNKDSQVCTKPEGHDGPHSTCTLRKHPFAVWPQDDAETTTDDTETVTMASQSTDDDSNGMSICPHCETHIGYTEVPFECDECNEFVPEIRL